MSFSSTPGLEMPVFLKAFDDPQTDRVTLAALLAASAPARGLALAPPRLVAHPHFALADLLTAAARPGSVAAALLTNAGVLLRLVELHYAGAAHQAAQQTFVADMAPIISHDSLLHLTLHYSSPIRSFARDVVRWHVQQRGDQEGLRAALRHSGDYGVVLPADYLEGEALQLTALDELEALTEQGGEEIAAFVSQRTHLVWAVHRDQRLAQAEAGAGQVRLTDDWWRFQQGATALRIGRPGAALATEAGAAWPVHLRFGLLSLTEPWQIEPHAPPPTDADWRRVAGEGIAALVRAGVG